MAGKVTFYGNSSDKVEGHTIKQKASKKNVDQGSPQILTPVSDAVLKSVYKDSQAMLAPYINVHEECLKTEEYLRDYLDFLKDDNASRESLSNRLVALAVTQELAIGRIPKMKGLCEPLLQPPQHPERLNGNKDCELDKDRGKKQMLEVLRKIRNFENCADPLGTFKGSHDDASVDDDSTTRDGD